MTDSDISFANPDTLLQLDDQEFQAQLLQGVSRTFALTIPQLPEGLYAPVANAYLLCRIVDTIEDEVSLTSEQKKQFCNDFIRVVNAEISAAPFAEQLAPLLSAQTIIAEHALIRLIPRVITITHSFAAEQIEALAMCVETMAEGMPVYQALDLKKGLPAMADMDSYCYHVAGCVGEMLTRLFCHYSPEIAAQRQQLLQLSVSFGQGLQMTNILKDIWDDAQRDVCWLPQDIFTETGFDLANLKQQKNDKNFQQGLQHLISIAHGHLQNALRYTLMLPANEIGLRNFCLWALGMAVLTLRKIKSNIDFTESSQVKISRKNVKTTIVATKLVGRSNRALTILFNLASRGLTTPGWEYTSTTSVAQA